MMALVLPGPSPSESLSLQLTPLVTDDGLLQSHCYKDQLFLFVCYSLP